MKLLADIYGRLAGFVDTSRNVAHWEIITGRLASTYRTAAAADEINPQCETRVTQLKVPSPAKALLSQVNVITPGRLASKLFKIIVTSGKIPQR